MVPPILFKFVLPFILPNDSFYDVVLSFVDMWFFLSIVWVIMICHAEITERKYILHRIRSLISDSGIQLKRLKEDSGMIIETIDTRSGPFYKVKKGAPPVLGEGSVIFIDNRYLLSVI